MISYDFISWYDLIWYDIEKKDGLIMSLHLIKKWCCFNGCMDDKKNHGFEQSMEDKKMMVFQRKYG